MLYIIIIFVFYLNKTVDCESYNKYSGYSGYSGYSRNIGYSNAFDSGNSLYSGNIGYSNTFNSGYSKSTNQKYLTFYNSYDFQSRQKSYSINSNNNFGYLSLINSYTLPVSKSYSNTISFSTKPFTTLIPTSLPSLEPTQDSEQFIPILSFETSMTLSGLTEPSLDTKAQSAVLIAVAASINISTNYVLFLGQEIITRRKLIIEHLLTTYNIKAITQINIPLTNQYSNINPATIYTSLTTNLANAISNGNFITFLLYASIALNSTSTQNVIVSNYSVSQMVLTNNNSFFTLVPSLSPSVSPSYLPLISTPTKDLIMKELIIIIFASMSCFIALLAVFYYVKIKLNKKNISVPLSIQEEDIILSINE
jgi:hypothetical protein